LADFATARDALMDSFEGLGFVVYDFVPPAVSTPCAFLFPDEPYIEFQTIGSSSRVKLRFRLTAAVANNDNQAALKNLEEVICDLATHLPQGAIIGTFGGPSITQVGATNLLVSESTVEITTTIS
jgi:hypothetical protein